MEKGIYIVKKKDGPPLYRATIFYNKKKISLGSYPSLKIATIAREEAKNTLSFSDSISDYHCTYLPFNTYVSLINFRDNGLYFSAPIFLYKNYFEYYISRDFHFTFDVDDLFYYSKHKIMIRKNHYFVYDFGSQKNILNRYGIKNYAKLGIDYLFINGDARDFRYSNIKVINKYNGVSKEIYRNKELYIARIHIHGDYTIGRYTDEETAAIAYNKACDYLKNKGLKKAFEQNYLENVSAIEYAKRYTRIRLPRKIIEYCEKNAIE